MRVDARYTRIAKLLMISMLLSNDVDIPEPVEFVELCSQSRTERHERPGIILASEADGCSALALLRLRGLQPNYNVYTALVSCCFSK